MRARVRSLAHFRTLTRLMRKTQQMCIGNEITHQLAVKSTVNTDFASGCLRWYIKSSIKGAQSYTQPYWIYVCLNVHFKWLAYNLCCLQIYAQIGKFYWVRHNTSFLSSVSHKWISIIWALDVFFLLSVIVRQQIWIIMMTRFAWLRFCFFECKINLSVALTTLTIWIWDICLYSVCRAFWMVQPNSMERAMEIVRNKIEPIANVSRHRWVYLEVHTTNK